MSQKNLDQHGRFRSQTVAFRVSPEEADELNRAVSMSGLTKQDYCISRCMQRDIVVKSNPRVYGALRKELRSIVEELKPLIKNRKNISPELKQTVELLINTLDGMKGEQVSE